MSQCILTFHVIDSNQRCHDLQSYVTASYHRHCLILLVCIRLIVWDGLQESWRIVMMDTSNLTICHHILTGSDCEYLTVHQIRQFIKIWWLLSYTKIDGTIKFRRIRQNVTNCQTLTDSSWQIHCKPPQNIWCYML